VQRGGRCRPPDIPAPKIHSPANAVEPVIPVHESLVAEKLILEDLLRLSKPADRHGGYQLADALTSKFIKKLTKHVKDMGDFLQQSVRVSMDIGYGLYHLDKELRCTKGRLPWTEVNDPDHTECLLEETMKDLRKCPLTAV
jgi:ferritin heavy chain